jgi:hypothetical protein
MICICKIIRTIRCEEHPDGVIVIRCALHREDGKLTKAHAAFRLRFETARRELAMLDNWIAEEEE